MVETTDDRATEAVQVFVFHRNQLGKFGFDLGKQFPGPVGAAIINDNDLVRHVMQPQFQMKVLHGGTDAAFLITRGNDHRQ